MSTQPSCTSLLTAEGESEPAPHPELGTVSWCRMLPALAENLLLMWQGNEEAEHRACAAGLPMRHAEQEDVVFGKGSLLICFVGSLLAALCLLTQALCVWHGPDRLGGAKGAPSIPSLALPLITALPLLPSRLRCHHRVTCQGIWPGGCSKRTQLKKTSLLQQGSCFAAKKEN